MPIQAGQNALASDFINESEADPTPANNAGKVPKLEADGRLSRIFQRSALTLSKFIPIPMAAPYAAPSSTARNLSDNTKLYLGQVFIPGDIEVASFSIRTGGTVGTGGGVTVSLYSEDGQTRYFSETLTVASAAGSTNYSKTLSAPVVIPAGVYWIGVNGVGTQFIEMNVYATSDVGLNVGIAPTMEGALTITAGTAPATINPGSIVADDDSTLHIRLDS